MISTTQLTEAFGRNLTILQRQADGLTHADSLLQPPFRGNCLNWVLGHMAESRDSTLGALGAAPCSGEAVARYARESEPITGDDAGALPLDELLRLLAASQEALAAALSRATPEDLARELTIGPRTTTVGARVFFLYFHETYHVGQTELLRQLAGANDKVI
jgi:uncharacterized damage-inducible protein DinB